MQLAGCFTCDESAIHRIGPIMLTHEVAAMKKLALVFLLTALAIPAGAQVVYSSGPTNANWYAWTINFGFVVSDQFSVQSGTPITQASFAMWLFPGDTLETAELSITSLPDGGTTYYDQTVNFTQGACTPNSFGYNVCTENTFFNGPTLNGGSYWLNLQNAQVPSGDPVYWDQNNGPNVNLNAAWENTIGSIPSETFTLYGETTFSKGAQGQSVPEPGSILMFATGALGFASLLRSRFSR
jgi:hypothetical protein